MIRRESLIEGVQSFVASSSLNFGDIKTTLTTLPREGFSSTSLMSSSEGTVLYSLTSHSMHVTSTGLLNGLSWNDDGLFGKDMKAVGQCAPSVLTNVYASIGDESV